MLLLLLRDDGSVEVFTNGIGQGSCFTSVTTSTEGTNPSSFVGCPCLCLPALGKDPQQVRYRELVGASLVAPSWVLHTAAAPGRHDAAHASSSPLLVLFLADRSPKLPCPLPLPPPLFLIATILLSFIHSQRLLATHHLTAATRVVTTSHSCHFSGGVSQVSEPTRQGCPVRDTQLCRMRHVSAHSRGAVL